MPGHQVAKHASGELLLWAKHHPDVIVELTASNPMVTLEPRSLVLHFRPRLKQLLPLLLRLHKAPEGDPADRAALRPQGPVPRGVHSEDTNE